MRRRPENFYELLTCGWRGHEIVGTDVATVGPADALVVRDDGAVRWYRCLRCDAWVPLPPPEHPTRETLPPRDEIAVPLRGPQLRDRYVLRLIACERAIHVLVFLALAAAIIFFVHDHARLEKDYDEIMNALAGGSTTKGANTGWLGKFRHYFLVNTTSLYLVAVGALGYALLESIEMVGLWFAQRWAEYLTLLSTSLFLPFEIYELSVKVSVLKILTLVVNLAIVLYLLWAKRLFGIRGGHRALEAMREAKGGWAAIEARPVPEPVKS